MKYKLIKSGPRKGLYEDENGLIYTKEVVDKLKKKAKK